MKYIWHRYLAYSRKADAEKARTRLKKKYTNVRIVKEKASTIHPRGAYVVQWYGWEGAM